MLLIECYGKSDYDYGKDIKFDLEKELRQTKGFFSFE